MDFCPYFAAYSNQNCQDTTHVSQQNAYGEIYGTESRCFDSTLTQEEYIGSSTITQMCYRHKCLNDALEITAISKNKNLVTITCTRADVGKIKTVDGFKGTLICPPVDDVCSTPATTQQNTDLLLCLNSSSSSTTTTTGTTNSDSNQEEGTGNTPSPSDGTGGTSLSNASFRYPSELLLVLVCVVHTFV